MASPASSRLLILALAFALARADLDAQSEIKLDLEEDDSEGRLLEHRDPYVEGQFPEASKVKQEENEDDKIAIVRRLLKEHEVILSAGN